MNKRGGIFEIFTAMGLFLAVAIIAFIASLVGGDVLGAIQDAGISNSTVVNDTINAGIATSQMGDVVFLIIFAGYILSLVVTSLATNFHPAFFFIFLILSILGVVIAAPISNAYQEIVASAAFAPMVVDFPVINMIMSNLPFVILMISALLMVVTYAKQRGTI
jgi:hypothetical protein